MCLCVCSGEGKPRTPSTAQICSRLCLKNKQGMPGRRQTTGLSLGFCSGERATTFAEHHQPPKRAHVVSSSCFPGAHGSKSSSFCLGLWLAPSLSPELSVASFSHPSAFQGHASLGGWACWALWLSLPENALTSSGRKYILSYHFLLHSSPLPHITVSVHPSYTRLYFSNHRYCVPRMGCSLASQLGPRSMLEQKMWPGRYPL